MTVTREFAGYCADLALDDLDDHTVDYAKRLLLDTLGTAVGGYARADSADAVLGAVRDLSGGRDAGAATVLATGDRLAAADAALANGAFSHSLDYDNRHSRGSLHVGSSVVSAALAAAERRGADGERFLTGVVAGYEVAARLGMACNPRSSHERGFHPTGTCGTFGATAAVGVVRGFDPDEFAAAFGVNGSQASGSYQCSLTGGWNKRLHPGLAARDAVLAGALAAGGFEAATAPIEGDLGFLQAYADRPVPERATEDLGDSFEVARTKIKPYPFGTFAHAPVSSLTELVAETDLDPDDVASITVEMPASGADMFGRAAGEGHPETAAAAQFDMPFLAALAVAAGRADLDAFDAALSGRYGDRFSRLMAATTTRGSDDLEAMLPERYPARVTVTTADAEYTRYRETVEGDPGTPMSWGAVEAKFADLAAGFDADAVGRIAQLVRTVETHPVDDLLAPFRARNGA